MKFAALAVFALSLGLPVAFRLFEGSTPGTDKSSEPAVLLENSSANEVDIAYADTQAVKLASRRPRLSAAELLMAAVVSETDPDRRADALEQAIASVSIGNLPTLLDSLMASEQSGAAELREGLLRRWADKDPINAAEWLGHVSDLERFEQLLPQVSVPLANFDAAAAVAWAGALPDEHSRTTAGISVAYETARTDPRLSLTIAATLPSRPDRDDAIVFAASQWAVSDSVSVVTWASSLPDSNLRERVLGAVAAGSADLASAAVLVAEGFSPGEEQNRAAVIVAQRWAQTEPQAAAAWVGQFPPSPVRTAAEKALTENTPRFRASNGAKSIYQP